MEHSSNMKEKTQTEKKARPSKSVKKKRTGAVIAVILACAAVIGLVAFGIYHAVLDYYLGKINIVTEEELIFVTEPIGTVDQGDIDFEYDDYVQSGESDLPFIRNTKKVTNILLIASDARGNEAGLSDSLILLSINSETKKIVMCSFLRDIWAKFPQDPPSPVAGGYDKLTHAHSYGGPALTIAVLKETFNIEVQHYAKVGFNSFIDLVNLMGGLDLYLTADEAVYINEAMINPEYIALFPNEALTSLEVREGSHHLNGVQVLAHARNRTLGSDWARTERQRTIISAMMSKAKNLSLSQINNLLETALPLVTTNMPKSFLKDLAGNALSFLGYDIVSTRIPLNGTYTEESYNIIPDLKVNCNDLYEKIYGEAWKAQ